jgi:hypothetical protein
VSETCPECGEVFEGEYAKLKMGGHRRREHGVAGTASHKAKTTARRRGRPPKVAASPIADTEPVEPTPLFDPANEMEPPPVAPKRQGFLGRWLKTSTPKAPGEIRPSRPKTRGRTGRTSLSPAGTVAWMGGAGVAMKAGEIPLGRTLQIQAGVAGDVIDRAIAGTRFDRIVQPLLGETDRLAEVGMLAALPTLVLYVSHNPDNAMAASALEMVVRQNLHVLAEGVRRSKLEDRKLADTVETLTGVGMDLGDNPVHAILSMIFAPVEAPAGSGGPPPGAAGETVSSPPPPPPSPSPQEDMSTNGQVALSGDPLPFGSVIVTPTDVPEGL